MLNVRIIKRNLVLRISLIVLLLAGVVSSITYVVVRRPFAQSYELIDQLGGNLFPSAILSVATTNTQVIPPIDGVYVGNPKSCIAIRLKISAVIARCG